MIGRTSPTTAPPARPPADPDLLHRCAHKGQLIDPDLTVMRIRVNSATPDFTVVRIRVRARRPIPLLRR